MFRTAAILRRPLAAASRRFCASEIPPVEPAAPHAIMKSLPPEAPPEGSCCGTGCANCVWIEYANSLTDYYSQQSQEQTLSEIASRVVDPNVKAFVIAELKMKWKMALWQK